jgi:hypothetical protein
LRRRDWQWVSIRITSTTASATFSVVVLSVVVVVVALGTILLQVHFRIEDDKLLLQALLIRADKVVLSEVHLEGVVIDVVLRVSATIAAITQVAAFVAVTAMREQFIVAVEALTTETTLGMTLETRLVLGTRDVVSMFFVPA